MVVEADPCSASDADLLVEMQSLGALLAQLQFERQHLSAALTERLQVECNRVSSMTRTVKQGKRSSSDEEDTSPQEQRRRKPGGEAAYRSLSGGSGGFETRSCVLLPQGTMTISEDDLDEIVDARGDSCLDAELDDLGPPTYRSCSAGGALDDEELFEDLGDPTASTAAAAATDLVQEATGLLDPSRDAAHVDLGALRSAVAALDALVKQQASAALPEAELEGALTAILNRLGGLAVR